MKENLSGLLIHFLIQYEIVFWYVFFHMGKKSSLQERYIIFSILSLIFEVSFFEIQFINNKVHQFHVNDLEVLTTA